MRRIGLKMAALGFAGSLFADGPFVGVWKLDPTRSTGSFPESETVVIREYGTKLKIHITIRSSDKNGSPTSMTYTVPKTGGSAHVEENPRISVSMKHTGSDSMEFTYLTNGKTVRSTRAVVSGRGETMTSRGNGVNAEGNPIVWVMVFEKQ